MPRQHRSLWRQAARGAVLWLAACACLAAEEPAARQPPVADEPRAWRIVVMDPTCEGLACDCVAGYARRNYGKLAEFLQNRLAGPIELIYAESLASPAAQVARGVDLIFGKFSEVLVDAGRSGTGVRSLAMLSCRDGSITQRGLFVVRGLDPARSLQDLKGYRVLLGPEDAAEKHDAAKAALEAFRLPTSEEPATAPSCNSAALAVVEKEADAAVVSSYAMPLLEGCGTIDKGAVRVIGKTEPVPFIGLFATPRVSASEERDLLAALAEVRDQPALLAALESRDGFVRLPPIGLDNAAQAARWPDWRGPRRDAASDDVPERLPSAKRLLWGRTLTGPGMAGLAVDAGCLVVADKDLDEKQDVFRCLDADLGGEIWKLAYPAAGKMEFTNSPRANPVIHQGLVYLLGAFGHLHCLRLADGQIVWKRNLAEGFRAARPTWGWSSTPLLVDDKLIVNPGAKQASLVALDRRTGKVLWSAPGDPPGYASFILAELGGRRQIVGYDAVSLGGWDPETGQRLWRLQPEEPGDFNVPTPVAADGKLLVSTENNGTRLYGFDDRGRVHGKPLAVNADLAPDTSTPVVHNGLVFGNCGQLVCLDFKQGLRTLWNNENEPFRDYCTFIAGQRRILVMTQSGRLFLLKATGKGYECVSSLDLLDDVPKAERDVWSHPALAGNRLYVRCLVGVYCFLME